MNALAIVIGLDKYATALESLTGAVADAHAFALWLVERRGLKPDQLRLGLEPDIASEPLPPGLAACPTFKPDVIGLNAVLAALRDQPPGLLDELYFFFSGHGASAVTSNYVAEAICLAGFTAAANHLALDIQSVRARLNAVPAVRRFLFIDGCRDQVYSDDIQFTRLANARPAEGVLRNFELRATSLGRKAAERAVPGVGFRGLFSRHLVDGLRGSGGAKRWDWTADGGRGGYVVRWDSLNRYVREKVGGPAPDQLVTRGGEHPAADDPAFAELSGASVEPIALNVRVGRPAPCPGGAEIIALRTGDLDPVREKLPAAGSITLTLPPSDYVLRALCAGFNSAPLRLAVELYERPETVELSLDTLELADPPPPPTPPPAPTPPGDGPQPRPAGDTGVLSGSPRGPVEGPVEPPGLSPGELTIRIGGLAPGDINPPLRVSVRAESGEVVERFPFAEPLLIPAGAYRVRAESSDGSTTEELVAIDPGGASLLNLAMPGQAGPALAAALHETHKPVPHDGMMLPSEALGPLASSSLSTVAIIAVAQAAQRYAGDLADLGLGTEWIAEGDTGVQAVIAEESDLSAPEVWAEQSSPRVRLWGMFATNHGVHRRLTPSPTRLPLSGARLPAQPGGYWLELEDIDRKRRSGFKLATTVFSEHVTLVMRYVRSAGRMEILQFGVPRSEAFDHDRTRSVANALVQAESFQRSRIAGRDPLAVPTAQDLADGKWFEPFSAFLLGAALADRAVEDPDARSMFDRLVCRLPPELVAADLYILEAIAADLAEDSTRARRLYAAALRLRQAPVVDRLLDPFARALDRYGFSGEGREWLDEKRGQAIGHPLWTLRREDDLRRGACP